MKARSILLFLTLLLAAPLFHSCRQVQSQPISAQTIDTPGKYTEGIDIPSPLSGRSEQILYRKAYIVSYNKETRQPNWVAWRLTADHAKSSNIARPGAAWHEDRDVPAPRAYHRDYSGTVYDRGHLCPAGDNKWDSVAMYESFLLSNASPQYKALNSGVWNQIEQSCRVWAQKYGEITIVCGPIFFNQEHDTIGRNRIPVPEAFFKVIVCLDEKNPKGIAFVCRNIPEGSKKKSYYVNSVAEVERITGITFFPNLPEKTAEKIKKEADINDW